MTTKTKEGKAKPVRHTKKAKHYRESLSDFCTSAWMRINGTLWNQKAFRTSVVQVFEFKKNDNDNEPEPIKI